MFKVILDQEWRATFKHAEDSAQFAGFLGDGAEIRHNGKVVWSEGDEEFSANESYDRATSLMNERIK